MNAEICALYKRIEYLEGFISSLSARVDALEFNLTERPVPFMPVIIPHIRDVNRGCQVCGIGANGEVMGYVCNHPDCPTRFIC